MWIQKSVSVIETAEEGKAVKGYVPHFTYFRFFWMKDGLFFILATM
jgi:hypothetical protein